MSNRATGEPPEKQWIFLMMESMEKDVLVKILVTMVYLA
jgi:hypothetical protein